MIQDPMVSALQGPPDPTMNALFPQRRLYPMDLLLHGQERLKDPNIPAYDPENTYKVTPPGTPTNPPPWGGGGQITQGGQDPVAAMFSHPAQHLQRMAGDVVPGPSQWYGAPPTSNLDPQSQGAMGMYNIAREGGPYAVDTLGIHMHPEGKRVLEMLVGPGR